MPLPQTIIICIIIEGGQLKTPQDYKKVRPEKYAQYFQGNQILPIPEFVEAKTLSLIIIDIKTRRLAGLKKDKFKELLEAAGILARYFCRCSFATWDILLPSQELATKLAGNSSITTKHYCYKPNTWVEEELWSLCVTCPSN